MSVTTSVRSVERFVFDTFSLLIIFIIYIEYNTQELYDRLTYAVALEFKWVCLNLLIVYRFYLLIIHTMNSDSAVVWCFVRLQRRNRLSGKKAQGRQRAPVKWWSTRSTYLPTGDLTFAMIAFVPEIAFWAKQFYLWFAAASCSCIVVVYQSTSVIISCPCLTEWTVDK